MSAGQKTTPLFDALLVQFWVHHLVFFGPVCAGRRSLGLVQLADRGGYPRWEDAAAVEPG